MKKLYVVGIGGGSREGMTAEALSAIEEADIIAGYKTYTDLVLPLIGQKEVYATGMMQEEARCAAALDLARSGKTVALVCSGDAGVYGMASLIYELCALQEDDSVSIKVISGVTAATSGAALLGAPLAHDFCVISLSNLLTEQTVIEKRLRAAAAGDFCIALYNPRSKHRPDCLSRACTILLETLSPATPCGWARNIGRSGEEVHVCTLSELKDAPLDMFCTAFVGNSSTRVLTVGGIKKLVTPRGYNRQGRLST